MTWISLKVTFGCQKPIIQFETNFSRIQMGAVSACISPRKRPASCSMRARLASPKVCHSNFAHVGVQMRVAFVAVKAAPAGLLHISFAGAHPRYTSVAFDASSQPAGRIGLSKCMFRFSCRYSVRNRKQVWTHSLHIRQLL